MNVSFKRLSISVLALGLTIGIGACSSDSDSKDTTTTKAYADDDTTGSVPVTDGTTADPTDCTADKNAGTDNLSGSAAVLFSADVTTGATEADITPELTVTIDGGKMEPSTLTVKADQMFGFKTPTGSDLDAVVVGCAGGQTMPAGVLVGFAITEPGTYPVSLDIEGSELGTITVE